MVRLRLQAVVLSATLCLLSALQVFAQDQEAATAPQSPPPPEIAQPAYDVFRIADGSVARAYRVWEEWVPQIVTTPDGGAWTFFTAQARTPDGFGPRLLYASRFDPEAMVWLAARSFGTAGTQYGASAVVDSHGAVHLVFSDRAGDGAESWSQLVYTRFADGAWLTPAPVAPHPDAGHQMLASLAIDKDDGLHVVWRDQRFIAAEARAALPTNADLVSSDMIDGEWSEPMQINTRGEPDENPAWPHLVADDDRLVVVWSIYRGTTPEEIKSAARVEWSSRPRDGSTAWSAPVTLYEREGGDAGGRLIDLAADPRGGAVVVYGLYNKGNNELLMQRLERGVADWTNPVTIATGDYGYLPTVTIASKGEIFVVFNIGRNRDVDIGGLVTDASGTGAGPVTLTPADDGVSARASISLDRSGRPWVVYMQLPVGSSNVTEIRSTRAAAFAP